MYVRECSHGNMNEATDKLTRDTSIHHEKM